MTRTTLTRLLRECLREGASVEIDGLGTFEAVTREKFKFTPETRPRVFLAYAGEDAASALRLYRSLEAQGYQPWLDRKKLLPGQNWPRAIEQAISLSDYFLPLFSPHSVRKRSFFQAELRYALDCASRLPLDETYIIPVRLGECRIPRVLLSSLHYVDLFPDWKRGVQRLTSAMTQHSAAKRS